MSVYLTKKYQEIASHWHSGQWSSLYQFASSGVYIDKDFDLYMAEIDGCLSNNSKKSDLLILKKFFVTLHNSQHNDNTQKN